MYLTSQTLDALTSCHVALKDTQEEAVAVSVNTGIMQKVKPKVAEDKSLSSDSTGLHSTM